MYNEGWNRSSIMGRTTVGEYIAMVMVLAGVLAMFVGLFLMILTWSTTTWMCQVWLLGLLTGVLGATLIRCNLVGK